MKFWMDENRKSLWVSVFEYSSNLISFSNSFLSMHTVTIIFHDTQRSRDISIWIKQLNDKKINARKEKRTEESCSKDLHSDNSSLLWTSLQVFYKIYPSFIQHFSPPNNEVWQQKIRNLTLGLSFIAREYEINKFFALLDPTRCKLYPASSSPSFLTANVTSLYVCRYISYIY